MLKGIIIGILVYHFVQNSILTFINIELQYQREMYNRFNAGKEAKLTRTEKFLLVKQAIKQLIALNIAIFARFFDKYY